MYVNETWIKSKLVQFFILYKGSSTHIFGKSFAYKPNFLYSLEELTSNIN